MQLDYVLLNSCTLLSCRYFYLIIAFGAVVSCPYGCLNELLLMDVFCKGILTPLKVPIT